jgi:hypothetical protein
MSPAFPRRIVSGGQTGVDRAALDVALERNIEHGGWCPLGRRAEDGRIPERYRLRETYSRDYGVRTLQNVLDSDATLILHRGPLRGGTRLTAELARQHGKPVMTVDLGDGSKRISTVRQWLTGNCIATLNIAGPRESQAAGITAQAADFLRRLLVDDERTAGN